MNEKVRHPFLKESAWCPDQSCVLLITCICTFTDKQVYLHVVMPSCTIINKNHSKRKRHYINVCLTSKKMKIRYSWFKTNLQYLKYLWFNINIPVCIYFYGGIYQPFTCKKKYKNYKICNLIMLTCKHSVGMQLINVTLQLTSFEIITWNLHHKFNVVLIMLQCIMNTAHVDVILMLTQYVMHLESINIQPCSFKSSQSEK